MNYENRLQDKHDAKDSKADETIHGVGRAETASVAANEKNVLDHSRLHHNSCDIIGSNIFPLI